MLHKPCLLLARWNRTLRHKEPLPVHHALRSPRVAVTSARHSSKLPLLPNGSHNVPVQVRCQCVITFPLVFTWAAAHDRNRTFYAVNPRAAAGRLLPIECLSQTNPQRRVADGCARERIYERAEAQGVNSAPSPRAAAHHESR